MNLEQIRNLPPKTVNLVLQSGGRDAAGLPPEAVQLLLQINRAAELMRSDETDGSQLAVARLLQQEFPDISLRTARRRVADCITYLYSDETGTPEQWHAFYADKMDRLGRAAETAGDSATAMRCYQQAHDYRVEAAAGRVDPERTRFRQIIVSPDLEMQRMGLDDAGIRALMQDAYRLIEQSDLPEKEKERLRQEAALETDYELVD